MKPRYMPPEVVETICQHLEDAHVVALSRVCKAFYSSFHPYQYARVDLSSHNMRHPSLPTFPCGVWEDYSRPRRSWALNTRLWRKQCAFLRTVSSKPEYGAHVRELCWTLTSQGREGRDLEIEVPRDDQEDLYDKTIWTVFKAMDNANAVDLYGIILGGKSTTFESLPLKLFTKAKKVSLGGTLPSSFVNVILGSISPANLTNLTLNNLVDRQIINTKMPSHWSENNDLIENDDMIQRIVSMPIRNALAALEGRCTSLQSLTVRAISMELFLDSANFARHMVTDIARIYQWRALFLTFAPQFEHFTFAPDTSSHARLRRNFRRADLNELIGQDAEMIYEHNRLFGAIGSDRAMIFWEVMGWPDLQSMVFQVTTGDVDWLHLDDPSCADEEEEETPQSRAQVSEKWATDDEEEF